MWYKKLYFSFSKFLKAYLRKASELLNSCMINAFSIIEPLFLIPTILPFFLYDILKILDPKLSSLTNYRKTIENFFLYIFLKKAYRIDIAICIFMYSNPSVGTSRSWSFSQAPNRTIAWTFIRTTTGVVKKVYNVFIVKLKKLCGHFEFRGWQAWDTMNDFSLNSLLLRTLRQDY